MRTEVLTESKANLLTLEPGEVEELSRLGKLLASKSHRPGFEPEEGAPDRTVIRCIPTGKESVYSVRVSEAVGVIGVLGRLQIEVRPKIPLSHLIHLMTAADMLPRLAEQDAEVDPGENLLELIARWYVSAAERLLRHGLIKDYSPTREFLAAKRGRLDMMRTTRAYYSGRIGFECEFSEFDTDTPLNRVIREAASVVVRSPSLSRDLRRRALRLRARMDGVPGMQTGDLRAELDRRSLHYSPALPLAKQLIRAEGRSLRSGPRDTWSFLVRTPELVEEGLRSILRDGLGPRWSVEKGRVAARGSRVTFSPDLEFAGGFAVGDVKYKIQGADWNRSDLNQIVTFVAAYDCAHGAVFAFREAGVEPLPILGVGSQTITSITWPYSDRIRPEQAADSVVESAHRWLNKIDQASLAVA